MMRIDFDGKVWNFDQRKVDVQTACIIKRERGYNWPDSLYSAIRELDPEAVQVLMWLVRKQNGHVERIEDVNGSPIDFLEAFANAALAEKDADPNREAADDAESSTTTS